MRIVLFEEANQQFDSLCEKACQDIARLPVFIR